jgi:amino acid efflux transporter
MRPYGRCVADAPGELQRSITLPQAVALYGGAVVGAGVLILPGVAASVAGPASLVAWGFDGLLGLPIAFTFAALASRFPDAGGVAAFASRAFGPAVGAIIGWFYFVAASVAQALVALTGAHYAADALDLPPSATFAVAGGILAVSVAANARGLRTSAGLQLILSASVAVVLLTAVVVAIPEVDAGRLGPFLPSGWSAVGHAAVLLFFAYFGWEAITHLSSEFRNPARDVPRATVLAVILVTALYLGVAFAVVSTATYGTASLDRIAVARVLGKGLGVSAESVAAVAAVAITLGTTNAFVAATSRLGYALGRDGALPAILSRVSGRGVPVVSVLVVGAIGWLGLLLAYVREWGAEAFLVMPTSLVIVVYLVGMGSGVRLLSGHDRLLAAIAALLCVAIMPFAGVTLAIPLAVAAAACAYRLISRYLRRPRRSSRRS